MHMPEPACGCTAAANHRSGPGGWSDERVLFTLDALLPSMLNLWSNQVPYSSRHQLLQKIQQGALPLSTRDQSSDAHGRRYQRRCCMGARRGLPTPTTTTNCATQHRCFLLRCIGSIRKMTNARMLLYEDALTMTKRRGVGTSIRRGILLFRRFLLAHGWQPAGQWWAGRG